MEFLPLTLIVIITCYLACLLVMILLWSLMPSAGIDKKGQRLNFSVLVPFRNESGRIGPLLDSLEALRYPVENFEVIFINDHSSDETVAMLEKRLRPGMNWKIIHVRPGAGGKKVALTEGIDEARFEHIVTTDADCHVSPEWLHAFDAYYRMYAPVFISAPLSVQINPGSFVQVMQYFEQSALTALGGITIHLKQPTMCNGANLSFTRTAFREVGGYHGNDHIPTGDDQFLLAKMTSKYPDKIGFLKTPDAVVCTPAMTSWSEMAEQRIRWASKWRVTGSRVMFSAVFVGLTYLSLLLLAALALFFDPGLRTTCMVLFAAKMIMDAWFVVHTRFNNYKWTWIWWPAVEIVYPIYVVFITLKSSIGTYSWKGRQYSAIG
jgi:biofilm PGA synthesis N-glycosyltransferase PgaC